eukprot:3250989-Prymnesium_polylepis.1
MSKSMMRLVGCTDASPGMKERAAATTSSPTMSRVRVAASSLFSAPSERPLRRIPVAGASIASWILPPVAVTASATSLN